MPTVNPGDDRTLYGVIALGGQTVAINIEAIREVIPRPPALLPFPATLEAVAGAVDLRGTLVPVLDPAALPGFPAPDADQGQPGIVTILRHDGRMFGVLTHAILGVADLGLPDGGSALRAIGVNPADTPRATLGPLLTASFIHGGWQGVAVDVAALAALPGLPHTPDSQQQHEMLSNAVPTLMFVAGDIPMAITAAMIDATLPDAPIAPPPLDDPLWIGMRPYKGRDIPLVDTLALCGFPAAARPISHGAGIVLRYPAPDGTMDYVALLISSVHDIAGLGADTLLPMTDEAIATSTMADALFTARGRVHIHLGEAALLAHPTLTALAGLRQTSTHALAKGPKEQAARRPFLIFTVGDAPLAVPLDDVDEIIRADIETLPMPHGGRALRALAIHRGASVPLVDLGDRLGLARGDGAPAFILLSRAGERRQGFLIDALRSVERVVAQPLRSATMQEGPSIPELMVQIDAWTTCQVIDLPGLIAA